jgi:hypothetical protein
MSIDSLVNVGHESIWLKPKTRVGNLQNAKVVHESPIKESIDIAVSQSEILVHVLINKIEVQSMSIDSFIGLS